MEKEKRILDFYLQVCKLKYKIRSGWDERHWNVDSKRIESIAEHVFGTCVLAMATYQEYSKDIDLFKVLKMLILHEIGETIIGDITPYDGISEEEKYLMEHNAILSVASMLFDEKEITQILIEFDEHKTKESKFAYSIDKLEADIQAKYYEEKKMLTLDNNDNNLVFNSERNKKIKQSGANRVFEYWYQNDKEKISDPDLLKLLKYLYENDITK